MPPKKGSERWHEEEAIQLLRATWYLVESLTADGVPFDGKSYQVAIDRAHKTQDWDTYLTALRTYADATKEAYVHYGDSAGKQHRRAGALLVVDAVSYGAEQLSTLTFEEGVCFLVPVFFAAKEV